MMFPPILRDVLKKTDGKTFDEIKVAGFIAINFACLVVGYRVFWLNDQFDAYSFLLGVAWALAAMAGGPAVRDRFSNPPETPPGGRQL